MLEARQDPPFLAEAPLEVVGLASAPDQLQGDRLVERVVVTHRTVDGAHAAVRDRVQDLVRPDPLRAGLERARLLGAVAVEPDRRREEATGRVVRGQQPVDLAAQLAVAPAGLVQERAPELRRARERRLEYLLRS